ncbi:hypothetical protein CPB84DRAFT_1155373 [Gymnopilus junonius]|uniref:Uncharacterized protein n=1 Tax=Gymnopilus junonius TaxID=109634 RepID=A0A9P5NJL7_GYMJU|nr:hypothetical protein CPB84DRAFT_1155373 [Gymnopilus junonius]
MGLYTLIDLMCECILIYRCWIMWKGRPLLTVVPSILAFASFATGFAVFAGLSSKSARRQALPMSPWWSSLWMASFALSMSVNFILTGLLIARVWLLYKSVSDTPGHVTRVHFGRIITALVESGAVLFFFQTLYLVNFCLGNTPFDVDSSPCAMVYGITPTLLYVIIALRDTVNPIHTNELPTHLYFIDRDRDHDNATHVSSTTVTVELGRTSMSSEGAFSSEEKDDIDARHDNSDP